MFGKNRLEKEIEQALANKATYKILLAKTNCIDDPTRKFLEGLNFRYNKIIKCWYSQTLYNLWMPQWENQFVIDLERIKKYQLKNGDLGTTIMADLSYEDIKNKPDFLKSLDKNKESLQNKVINYFKKYLKT